MTDPAMPGLLPLVCLALLLASQHYGKPEVVKPKASNPRSLVIFVRSSVFL